MHENYTRDWDAKLTASREIEALIGLLYLERVLKTSHLRLADLWATDESEVGAFWRLQEKRVAEDMRAAACRIAEIRKESSLGPVRNTPGRC
ncbi:hypothetical protein JTB14_037306 [Gonioctena quinquepunctata]|nr:hypothetical protein JTB14_037306 [Gonioctena quinquepunctata]